MIEEINHNDLSVDEQIDLLEELRQHVDNIVQKKIKKIKSDAIYCPFCGKYYNKLDCKVREAIEDKEVCIFKSFVGDGEVYEKKSCRMTYVNCPEGHELKYEKMID